jgi:Endoribonuclease L-PSP
VPENRKGDLIYFNVPDRGNPLGFNSLEWLAPEKRSLAAAGLLDAFKKIWSDSWGPRLEHILRNAFLALLDQPRATLTDVLRLLDDHAFRREVSSRVYNTQVRDFWLREYENYPLRLRAEAIAPSEFRRSMEHLRRILRACGSDLDKVARVNAYVKDAADLPEYNRLYREYFKPPYPARTTITNCLGKVKFEIDVIAVSE